MSDETGVPDEGAGDDAEPEDVGTDDEIVVEAEVVESATSDRHDADDSTVNDQASPGSGSAHDDPVGDVLAAVTNERDEYLDALRRLQAEFENFRKQALKRQGDAIEHATGGLVGDLLTVLDACDAGIEHGDEGVTAIFTTLLGVLEKAGLERLDPLGEPFDPNAHEAVMHEPDGDGAEGPTVVDVLRPGYRWKERTLRAAMVKVRG